MKKLLVLAIAIGALTACEGRSVWQDNGKVKEATTDREVWDSNGKMDTGDRSIWNDSEGNPVIN